MRWKQKTIPHYGARRVVDRFLLFPKCLGGEWRWLEQVQIQQIYKYFGRFLGVSVGEGWGDLYWVGEEDA